MNKHKNRMSILLLFVICVVGCQSKPKSEEEISQREVSKDFQQLQEEPCVYSEIYNRDTSCSYDSWSKLENKSLFVSCIGKEDSKAPAALRGFCAKKTCSNLKEKVCASVGEPEILVWQKSQKKSH